MAPDANSILSYARSYKKKSHTLIACGIQAGKNLKGIFNIPLRFIELLWRREVSVKIHKALAMGLGIEPRVYCVLAKLPQPCLKPCHVFSSQE